MNTHRRSERGQALILIVAAMVALIGITGLAIDGGNVYSDRRHAQNAADTASLAAGLSWIHSNSDPSMVPNMAQWPQAEAAGLARATANGYNNSQVIVRLCSLPGATCVLPGPEPYTDSNGNGKYDYGEPFVDTNHNGIRDPNDAWDFIQVIVTSQVNTYFAKIVGVSEITNAVQAVANAVPPGPIPWYNGNGIVSLMQHCKPTGYPYDPFTLSGGSSTIVRGSGGIFVNSDCDHYAFTSSSNITLDSVSGTCVVGGAYVGGIVNPPVTHNCSQVDPNIYQLPAVDLSPTPNLSCPQAGTFTTLAPNQYLATPGYYNQTFPPVSGQGTILVAKGIYCLNNGMNLNSQWTITTDIDGNGKFDGSDGTDEGALFYVPHGSVTVSAGVNAHIGAINKPGTSLGIKGYLFYLPPSNSSDVTVSGSSGSGFVGTIIAPASFVTLEGGGAGTSMTFECQVIGYAIRLTGGGTLNITFNQGQNGTTLTKPQLKPYQ